MDVPDQVLALGMGPGETLVLACVFGADGLTATEIALRIRQPERSVYYWLLNLSRHGAPLVANFARSSRNLCGNSQVNGRPPVRYYFDREKWVGMNDAACVNGGVVAIAPTVTPPRKATKKKAPPVSPPETSGNALRDEWTRVYPGYVFSAPKDFVRLSAAQKSHPIDKLIPAVTDFRTSPSCQWEREQLGLTVDGFLRALPKLLNGQNAPPRGKIRGGNVHFKPEAGSELRIADPDPGD